MLQPKAPHHPLYEGRHLARNVMAGGSSSLIKVGVQLAMLPIMGHLLGPREFGLYATVLPLVSFFTVIADGGLGISMAKEETSHVIVWSTAFYVTLAVGVALATLVSGCGFVLASVMHESKLLVLLSVLSLSFLLIGVSVLPAARLMRRNDLVTGSWIDVYGSLFGAGIGLVFALKGFGALSLAFQSVGGYAVRAVALNALAFEAPTADFSLKALADHINTGGVLVAGRLLDLLCRLTENLLFSVTFGPAALGAYTFANQVSRFLCEAASNPIWSALYTQTLREPERSLASLLAGMARLMTLTTFPVACIASAAAPRLLHDMLGAKWTAAGPLIQILMPSFSLVGVASLGGAVLLAREGNRAFLVTFAFLSIGRVAILSCGHWAGILGVGWGLAAVHLAYMIVMGIAVRAWLLRRDALVEKIGAPFMAGIVGGLITYIAAAVFPAQLVFTLAAIVVGGVAFLGCLFSFEGRQIIHDVLQVLGALSRR